MQPYNYTYSKVTRNITNRNKFQVYLIYIIFRAKQKTVRTVVSCFMIKKKEEEKSDDVDM